MTYVNWQVGHLPFDMPQSRIGRTAGHSQSPEAETLRGRNPHPPWRTHSHSLPHSHSVLARDGSKLPHSKFRELFLSLVRHAAKPNMSNSWFVRTQTKEPPTPHPPRRTHSHSPPHSHSVTARDGSKLPHSDAGARSNAYSPVPPEIYALFKKANLPRRQAPKNKPSTKTTDPYLKAFKPVTSIAVMSK
jgi:hypothetical protein